VARHAEDTLTCARIAEILNLPFTVPAAEAIGAEGLVPCEDGQILDLVSAVIAAVGAVVADEGAVAEEKEVRIGIEEGTAGVAAEAIDVPSVASWVNVSSQ
jgi:hypothetical protein